MLRSTRPMMAGRQRSLFWTKIAQSGSTTFHLQAMGLMCAELSKWKLYFWIDGYRLSRGSFILGRSSPIDHLGLTIPDRSSRIVRLGSLILDRSSRIDHPGSIILGCSSWINHLGSLILDRSSWIAHLGSIIPD